MGNKPLSPDFFMSGYQIGQRNFKNDYDNRNTPDPHRNAMIGRATNLAFRSTLGILEPNRRPWRFYGDDEHPDIIVAIRRNVPDAVEILVDRGDLETYGGDAIVNASDIYSSMLSRGDTLGISKAARILAVLLVADPKLIDKLHPYQRVFTTHPVYQEAINKRVREVAAKRRMGLAKVLAGKEEARLSRIKNWRTSQAAAAVNNAVLSGKVETDDDKAPLLSAATSAPVNNPKYEGGLRRLKTQRRHRSTAAKVSKRLRRKTARASASSRARCVRRL